MIRSSSAAVVTLLAVSVAACDRTTSLDIVPELEEETSFETGLEGWSVDRGAGSAGSAAIVTGDASEGSSYVRVTLDGGADFVWLERFFVLEPNTPYSVTVFADLRAFDGSADIRVRALGADPDGSGFASQGPVPDAWERTLAPVPVTTDGQGRAWVALGVAGTGQPGTFGIDRLGASFLRTGGL